MTSRRRPIPTLVLLGWLLPAAWLLAPPLLAMGDPQPQPRPRQVPVEIPVGDLGGNERLPESLRSRYRPAPAGVTPALQAGALGFPLAQRPTEVAPFGWRLADSSTDWRLHTGLDLVVPEGTPVLSALPGTVRLVDEVADYGLVVVIDHGLGWQSLYGHLLDVAVLPGAGVAAAAPIGRVGRSGSASTAQLHFEWRQLRQGRLVAVDPSPLLQAVGFSASVARRPLLP
ncbi:M23 family metallopeptidase [Synechococcus sp. CCY 9618]|uniref:M23 family metallopeptidase n=1 Tax=Synechococcus sp. CCY 9618 TaxID=2815602 RepID=UPI001C247C27|nr:M23 family metallopeptidase [Synechococcus sp. CCY 9618]